MNSKHVKVSEVSTEGGLLSVWLSDGRILGLPLAWYPSLANATATERALWQPSGAGRGIHWPALDYDLRVEGLLEGRHEHPSAQKFVQKVKQLNKTTKNPFFSSASPRPAARRRTTKRRPATT